MPIGVVHVLGSLNIDHSVRVNRHPAVGQTVWGQVQAATPGGKGLNQAVAAARAGRSVERPATVPAMPFAAEIDR